MTQTSSTKKPAPPQLFKTGQELYDFLMKEIEPELTSEQLPLMAEKYKDETPEEAKTRSQRYAAAFLQYQEAHEQYVSNANKQMKQYKSESFVYLEEKNQEKEEGELAELESLLQ